MKRIKYACLAQSIHFKPKVALPLNEAAELVRQEVAAYMAGLDRRNVKYKVEEETVLPDGSIMVKLRKQYNTYSCGTYLE